MGEQFCSDIKRNIYQRKELAKEVDSVQLFKKKISEIVLLMFT